jgi:hypothetical protein
VAAGESQDYVWGRCRAVEHVAYGVDGVLLATESDEVVADDDARGAW